MPSALREIGVVAPPPPSTAMTASPYPMKPSLLKPTPHKQVLADAVLNALDEKAIILEAVEQGDAITLTATFEDPIEKARLEVVDHALKTLRETGVLTRSLPRVDVYGRNNHVMSIRFPNKADFCSTNEDDAPINFGRFSIRKKDRKKVGPFPIDNISPMFQNAVPPVNNNQHRNRNNRNNNRNRNHQDSDDDYGSIDSQVKTETVDYDAFYEAMELKVPLWKRHSATTTTSNLLLKPPARTRWTRTSKSRSVA